MSHSKKQWSSRFCHVQATLSSVVCSWWKHLMNYKKRGLAVGQLFWIMSPFHHSKATTELFPSGGPFSLMFLPPAPPFFNPIENVFGIWKNMVCQAKARSEAELMQVINTTASKISAETIMNCILHADHNCESFKMVTTMSIETVPFTCNGTWWLFSSHFS